MKNSRNLCLSIAILSLVLLGACEKPMKYTDMQHQVLLKNNQELPFKAKFYTKRSFDDEGIGKCTEDPFLAFNLQKGEGNATHLGKFTTTMWFCGSPTGYKNGEGVFIAANGDELYFNVPSEGEIGHVLPLPDPHPLYELYFKDPFTFTGGTGRFEGASGGGYTDSLVDLLDDDDVFIDEHQTDHVWSGVLILPKKR